MIGSAGHRKLFDVVWLMIMGSALLFPLDYPQAMEVVMSGNRMSIAAENTPLRMILREMVRQGVQVFIDPEINPRITATQKNVPVEQILAAMLRDLDHAAVWRMDPDDPKRTILAEIRIFEKGKPDRARSLDTEDIFPVARDPVAGFYYVRDEILVRIKTDASLESVQKWVTGIGGSLVRRDALLGVLRVQLPEGTDVADVCRRLSDPKSPVDAEPNYAYPIASPLAGPEWPILQFRKAAQPPENAGVSVAVLDSGFSPGYGLEDYVVASLDAVNPGDPVTDALGHGTQMALIASGLISPLGAENSGGEAASVSVVPIRIFDTGGFTSDFTLLNSIDYAIQSGARVLSLSWGSETDSRFLEDALAYADRQGLIVVASAGNTPDGIPVYPAAYKTVIGVGALQADGTPWDQSNFGDFVTISAPGMAAFPVGYHGGPGYYAGTSIAAAFVAREAAGYLTDHPEAHRKELLNYLKNRFYH